MSTSLLACPALQETTAKIRATNNAHFVISCPVLVTCGISALVVTRKVAILFYDILGRGNSMKKFLVTICSVVLALGLAGCWGKGKAPVGKGKAPVVQTRG